MIYVKTENNIVIDVLRVPPNTIYPQAYASQFVEAPDGVGHGWTESNGVFAPPPEPPIAARQDAALKAIKAERDRRKFAGVKVGADWFHCDLESRSQWERMANKADKLGLIGTDAYIIGGQPVPWKTMTGTFVVLTAGKIFAVVDAIELQEVVVFGAAEAHRVAMEASATPEIYDFSGGWPATFEAAN